MFVLRCWRSACVWMGGQQRRRLQLRARYVAPSADKLNYFPGHMQLGLYQMEAKLRAVDAVIEVHDARVPLSGRNPRFSRHMVAARPHLLVLNKADLVPESSRQDMVERLRQQGDQNVVFTNCQQSSDPGLRSVVPRLQKLLERRDAEHRMLVGSYADRHAERCCMVMGVPNVGKSSLINALRSLHMRESRATKVGAVAGVTRSVLTRIRVSHRPLLYVLDTPGVLVPQVRDVQATMRLALCAALQDHMVGPEVLADYLLYWLNRRGEHAYVSFMCVHEPTDDIGQLLAASALALGKTIRRKDLAHGGGLANYPDTHSAARRMINGFRTAQLGRLVLDDIRNRRPTAPTGL